MPPRLIVMLGARLDSKERGGIVSVVDVYRREGLFARWPIAYVGTVASGSALFKARVAIGAFKEFLRILATGRAALIHAHTASRASFWRKSAFILAAFVARRPVILHLHGAEFETFFRDECGPLRKAFVRFMLSRVDRVVVLSSQWRLLVESIAPRARVLVVFNPISIGARRDATTLRSENVLLFLGRFGRRKGVYDLLEALAIVRARFPSVRLKCGGDGDAAGVAERARALGLEDCVEVLGWVSGEAKERALAEAAVYVLPTYAEGMPMGVLEAMAAGAPVVATAIGGIPDAIEDGVEGFLIRPGDIEALADRIARLLDSAQLRDSFARAARRKVEDQFAAERIIPQVEALYERLGASRPSPGECRRSAAAVKRG